MNGPFKFLEWDSDLFKMNVWKFTASSLSKEELRQALADLIKLNADLVYYLSPARLENTDNISNVFEFSLVDIRTTYVKQLTENSATNECISPYDKSYPEKKLIELAIESGRYSRFNADKRLPKELFRELYTLWIVNSVNRKIANEVLVYTEENLIKGFITLGEKNKIAHIGIVAVDANSRRSGVGKALLNAGENWFLRHNYSNIRVVTQADNAPACGLYESCQYNVGAVEYVYHIWKNKSLM
jgi:dTDP-4-amino-4,6-dideoxy-D-galactose acyltransferase